MNKQQAAKESRKLAREIEKHNELYYVKNQPTISDKEYDDLLKRLLRLEADFPDLKRPDSPTQRIGSKVSGGARSVRHRVKMYSLDNTYSREEVEEWRKRVEKGLPRQNVEYLVELKVDGVSAALTYEDGLLTRAATRGDGTTGEEVTPNIKTIPSVPLRLKARGQDKPPSLLDVRGEVYMEEGDFEKVNRAKKRKGETVFANPRNAASGSLKLLDARITAERNLRFYVHSYGLAEGKTYKTHEEFLDAMRRCGFPINPNNRLCRDFGEVLDYYDEFLKRREDLPYEVDGVVIKINSFAQREKLGETHKSPRWAVAYKFPAHQATTVVEDIIVQVGRTGILTPVAELKPVECGGVTISRSTLHNFDEIERLGVRKGDRVLVERAGDVIPKVIKVVQSARGKKTRRVSVPKKCPACGGRIAKDKSGDVAYRCINPSCPKQMERKLVHFVSRGAMDIDGMGESVITQLLEKGLVKDLADIYKLSQEDLLSLELFAAKKAENLLQAIAKSKRRSLSRFLFALGIPHVGEKAAATLAKEFGSLRALLKAEKKDFERISDFGEVMAAAAADFFQQESTKKLVEKFKREGLELSRSRQPTRTKPAFADKKFVFTGEMKGLPRKEAGDLVRKFGGEVTSSVSKNTDFVVVGEAPGSKYDQAKKIGIKTLNQKQFEEMINE